MLRIPPGEADRLTKLIPVAAGLGGGSADAAATLRLLTRQAPHQRPVQAFLPLAAKLGADIPACLLSKPAIMAGIGDGLGYGANTKSAVITRGTAPKAEANACIRSIVSDMDAADGVKIHGCSVHYVVAEMDAGPIIAQEAM